MKMNMKKLVALCTSVMMLVFVANGYVSASNLNPFDQLDKAYLNAVSKGLQPYFKDTLSRRLTSESQKPDIKKKIVKIKDSVLMNSLAIALSGLDYEFIGKSTDRLVLIPSSQFVGFAKKYGSIVEFSDSDSYRKILATPNDLIFNSQWALKMLNFPKAWNTTKGSLNVKVGVIDTGLRRTHVDLAGPQFLNGFDVASDGPVVSDSIGHGSMVSSIIGASTNNKACMAGGLWKVTIIPIKVSIGGYLTLSNILKGLTFAADSGCKVVNLSLGGGYTSPFDQYYIDKLNQKGCIVVAASGNSGNTGYLYPASNENVISVGAVTSQGKITYYSQVNDMVDVAAPGDYVLVASKNNSGYEKVQGTSFASPYAAAVIALMCSVFPKMTYKQLQKNLPKICVDKGAKGRDDYFGCGIIDAEKAVKIAVALAKAAPTPKPTPTSTPTPTPTVTPTPTFTPVMTPMPTPS